MYIKSKLLRIALSLIILIGILLAGGGSALPAVQAENSGDEQVGGNNLADATQALTPSSRTDQVIVAYKPGGKAFTQADQASQMDILSAAAGVELQYAHAVSGDAHALRLPERLPVEQVDAIAKQLMSLPEVLYAEPDLIMFPALAPNDPQYPNQWHYYEQYGINLPAAWNITTGSSNIVVAVVDTGITNHADLAGRTVPGYDFIGDVLVANDGNGRDSDPSDPGDWITSAENQSGYFQGCGVSDSSWHGTHTAGTVGAASNNGIGVTGVNWNSKILPVRVLGKCGGYTTDIVDGVRWSAGLSVSGVPANTHPAKVVSLSLGGSGSCGSTWQNAVNDVIGAGAVMVVAAGNGNTDASNFSPANCSGVITVAATNRSGSRSYYSNYGSTVEISAPGGATNVSTSNGVLSTLNTGATSPASDSYEYYQGTSMATPHVSGVASLLFSLNPSLTPAQVLTILQSTAQAFPGGSTCNTSICGSGIVDAGAALASIASPPGAFSKTSPANGATGQSTSPTLSWGTSAGAATYEYCYDSTNDNACTNWIANEAATSANLLGLAPNVTYYWQVKALNGAGTAYGNGAATAFWSFTTAVTPPGAFSKTAPVNGASGQSTSPTLSWETSNAATSYEYCLDTTNDSACAGWVSTGANKSVSLSGLSVSTTYYWQVRALNPFGTTYANGGAFWVFTTGTGVSNDDFNTPIVISTSPYTNTQDITGFTTAWDDPILPCAEGGTKYYSAWYRYTPTESKQLTLDTNGSNYDTVLAVWTGTRGSLVNAACDDDSGTGTASLVSLSVTSGVTYSIEVVSYYADVPGTSLTLNGITSANPPGAFGKTSPANGASGQSTSPTLQWGTSSSATSYEYCYDTTDDAACSSWISAGASTSASLSGLSTATTYYWQVRANNAGGSTYGDGAESAYWSFTTVPGANNDDFDTPLVITTTPYANTQSVSGYSTAADDPDLPCASGKRYLSAWYQFTPAQGGTLDVNTEGSNYDTILAVWTGTRGSLVNVGCNDAPGTSSSSLSLSLTAGVVYSIEITSYSSIPRDANLTFHAAFTPVPPGAFSKSAPGDAATYVAMNPVLAWDASSGASSYEYCIDTINNASCDGSWVSVGTALKVNLSGLSEQTFHYWQVRAVNPGGTTFANGGSWWSFKTRLFNDVDGNYWARDWIERLYNASLTIGCNTNPLVFCPESQVTRAEMAVFLERGMRGISFTPPAASGIFIDVPTTHWAASWIEQLYDDGITAGCLLSPLSYCPAQAVTRAQMAVFLLKAEHGSTYAPPSAVGVFSDVAISYWAAAWIEQLFAEGITAGCDVGKYCPEQAVTRAQMAVFLVRTFNLP